MSTEIYYFSGTGNSLHVAKELQKRIPETKLIPIVSLLDKEFIKTNSEIVGFIFPQYASTMPKIVAKFIDKLDLKSAKYIFAVSTRGGTICRSFIDIDKILKKSSRKLNSYFVLTMPSGSELLVKSFPNNITEERITKLESEMLNRLDSIQRIIINREINREEDTRHISPLHPFLKLILPIIHFFLPIFMKIGKLAESRFDFYYDFKCSGCAICEMICLAKKNKNG
jgi:flavodoxin